MTKTSTHTADYALFPATRLARLLWVLCLCILGSTLGAQNSQAQALLGLSSQLAAQKDSVQNKPTIVVKGNITFYTKTELNAHIDHRPQEHKAQVVVAQKPTRTKETPPAAAPQPQPKIQSTTPSPPAKQLPQHRWASSPWGKSLGASARHSLSGIGVYTHTLGNHENATPTSLAQQLATPQNKKTALAKPVVFVNYLLTKNHHNRPPPFLS